MVDFILGIDWWLRALILAATLIIFAAHYFGEYMPAIVIAGLTALFIFAATGIAPDNSKWGLFGDFFGTFWCHKFFIGGWTTIYLICWLLFIILI